MINNELLDLGNWIIKTTQNIEHVECRVNIQNNRGVELRYREKKPEIIKEAIDKNLTLDLFIDGKYSSQTTPDLRKSSLESFIRKSIENTKFIEKDTYRSLTDSKYFHNINKELSIYDHNIKDLSIEELHKLVSSLESYCLDHGGDKVISVESNIWNSESEDLLLTSNGFKGSNQTTNTTIYASISMQDEGDRKPYSYGYARVRNLSDLPSTDDIGKQAILNTKNLLGAKKINTEKLPIIIENKSVPRILGGFVNALYGSNIQQKRSFLSDKKGKVVTSNIFTIMDDPFVEKGIGSRLYDYDGLPAKKMLLVNEGKVENFYLDWYYSRKLEMEPTTGRSSNLVIQPGNKSVEELMKNIGRGILVTGFIGGNSNSTTGDFSVGIEGQLFDNGKPIQAIAEMNIADNHLNFWNKLSAIGNDPWKYSSWITPSLVFNDIVISGS